jgi:hypothetical protein
VLRLLRDRLLASIEPSRVCWVRLAGAISPRIVAKRSVEATSAGGDASWQSPLAALSQELNGLGSEALDVSVVLSNHFVRYVLIPPAEGASSVEEELALARFHFAKVYGERAKAWHVRLAPGRRNAPRLSCATDSDLVDALKACLPASGTHRLVSVQPYLMAAFSTWRDGVPGEGAWMLLLERDRACVGLYCRGGWRAIRNTSGRYPNPDDWLRLLERERLRTAGDAVPQTALVRASARVVSEPRSGAAWRLAGLNIRPLPGYLPLEDEHYVMGLCAL